MAIKLVENRITRSALEAMAPQSFEKMVKVVVDLGKLYLAAGGEVHAEGREFLLRHGSVPRDLWGVRMYFRGSLAESVDPASNINVRPEDHNPSIRIQNPDILFQVMRVLEQRIDWSR